ncbi:type 2 isopentenyl-diphosphate Delta-isomerase [Staphylococcus equorum]|uniref:type 2 isopentenyl-diphosphate Delta-isomerase n=1 Tax=Staphylococcus equorum TaxID=246432 RepID=UPI0021BDFD9E|nr:type 2 isopentenyl-diphosphate Delta-isomerase [Staphylococcus equorum]MDK9858279.1 type 2 isopentenyl-diphosphate Delta-isomerase [Staphylococcus equorum]MDK9875204.1 type 2 isopentenyl-diphosphate Delta-isomerase [Staphylococcus equorum]
MSDNKREQRKNEHVEIAMAQQDATISDFDEIRFVHHSIPNIDVDDVNIQSELKDFTLKQPLYINAMTGGSEWTKEINEKLAIIARETGMAMAVGSTHAALRNSKMILSFSIVRETNPDGIIFSNVGADVPVDKAVESVKLLDAQALQVHVNAPQELVMPEGNRTFSTWMENLAQIVAHVDVPVIVKEVGFGMSKETIKQLHEIGIRYVDVSGRGGTNFVDIENERRTYKDMDYLGLWGQTTVESLLESTAHQQDMDILASGGVRTPLDAVKCLALGASAVGMSRPFLNQVEHHGITEAINYAEQFTDHMKKIMTMLDTPTIKDLKQSQMIFSPKLESWIEQRGLDIR